MTNKEVLEAAQEILSLNSFVEKLYLQSPHPLMQGSSGYIDLDEEASRAVQILELAKRQIVFPDAKYEKWVD